MQTFMHCGKTGLVFKILRPEVMISMCQYHGYNRCMRLIQLAETMTPNIAIVRGNLARYDAQEHVRVMRQSD